MEKYKHLNEDVLDDEKHPELIERAQTIQNKLMELLLKFKGIAKAKGLRYDISTKEDLRKDSKGETKDSQGDYFSRNRKSSVAQETSQYSLNSKVPQQLMNRTLSDEQVLQPERESQNETQREELVVKEEDGTPISPVSPTKGGVFDSDHEEDPSMAAM